MLTDIDQCAPAETWRSRYAHKLTDPAGAIAQIRRGDRILLAGGSTVPTSLLPFLVAPDAPTGDNEILHLYTMGDAPYVAPEFERRFRHNALFIGPNVRAAVNQGRADYTPIFLGEIPRMIRDRHIPIDIALVSVTPPNEQGVCCLGPEIDITPAAIDAARLVIAEINPHLPWTFGDTCVHIDKLDVLVEASHALPELLPPAPRAETEEIATNVARLVMDGATIQVGIGALPNAVLRHLKDHRDLGLPTEMFSDGIVDLVECGALTGAKKSIHPGKIVASIVMGTQRVYDFINRNPMVELFPVDYVNDPFLIAKHDYMTAINTALAVDLTGQVCSDSIGDKFYSGIGGQVDFIRGAARALRGKPIICLPSTAADGNISRIKPSLTEGAGVVTTRGDVHFVVTEYGIAYLHGKSVRERALALIQIAHPKFRSWLLAEAKRRHFVYRDQAEPVIQAQTYPRQYEWNETTRSGRPYRIRPIKPTDEAMLHEMFYKFTRKDIYRRFFSARPGLGQRGLARFCAIDYQREMTLVATVREDVITQVVGLALYVQNEDTGIAQAAILVADNWQNEGIGATLIERICDIAREHDVRRLAFRLAEDSRWTIRLFEPHGTVTTETGPDNQPIAMLDLHG